MRPRTTTMATAQDGSIYLNIIAKTPDGAKALNFILRNICRFMEENAYMTDTLMMSRTEGRKAVGYDIMQYLGEDLFFAVLQTKYE